MTKLGISNRSISLFQAFGRGVHSRGMLGIHGQPAPDRGGVYLGILKTDGDVSRPFRSIVHFRNEENWLGDPK